MNPCKDCLILPICLTKYEKFTKHIMNDGIGSEHISLMPLVSLFDECNILKDYIYAPNSLPDKYALAPSNADHIKEVHYFYRKRSTI